VCTENGNVTNSKAINTAIMETGSSTLGLSYTHFLAEEGWLPMM
jgi:hypothetical protein